MRCRRLVVPVAAAVLLGAPVAHADSPPAIDQYVESMPAADGSTSPHATTHASLPRHARAALTRSGGSDAAILEQVATSGRYGAPARRLRPARKTARPTPAPSPLSAVPAVAGIGGGSTHGGWLVVVLAVMTVFTGVAVVRQRR